MAIIDINAASKKDGQFTDGTTKSGIVRRKFLVNVRTYDENTLVPSFQAGVNAAQCLWVPMTQTVTVTDEVTGEKTAKVINPAEQLTRLLEKVKTTGERVRLHATISRLNLDEPTPSEKTGIVYQTMTVQLDEQAPKRFALVEPSGYDFPE